MNKDCHSCLRMVTFDELQIEVQEEYNLMSEEELYHRTREGDPTFLQWALTQMSIQKIDVVNINEFARV